MSLKIDADGWLAELFGHPVFRVDVGSDGRDLAPSLRSHAQAQARAFYYAKIDCKRAGDVQQLGSAGMFVVDTNVGFELARPPARAGGSPGVTVDELTPGDADLVLDIAGSAYQYSRFHLDPLVPDELAHRIKREWCRNYVRKVRGDRLFVAKIDGRPVGFLAALRTGAHGREAAVIDLVGVDRGHQRRGVGAALTQAFIDHYRGATSLQVGTQVANVPSMRLYEQLGFSITKTQYVLHLHVQDGSPRG
ncbi:MAG: N-acetyltransferase family protein [Polyangia bacterium]